MVFFLLIVETAVACMKTNYIVIYSELWILLQFPFNSK